MSASKVTPRPDPAEVSVYGYPAAALLNHIRFWVKENAKNERNLQDGRHWTYDTYQALADRLILTAHQVRRGIEKLIRLGVIVRGYFNSCVWDRRSWYTLAMPEQECEKERTETNGGQVREQPEHDDEEHVQPVGEATKQATPVSRSENPVMDYVRKHGVDILGEYGPNEVDLRSVDFMVAKGVKRQFAFDWMITRSNKPMTPWWWSWVEKEANTAGITPQAAVKWAAQHSYEIFKAEWYLNQNPRRPATMNAGLREGFGYESTCRVTGP
ncbi:hypothetical protein [Paraburkholderia tropica]|uniref:hypothetical protein n=1 Tax=Paraburkholderia tropica TaxID=92647 RepID=UPI002AB2B624|nr:hypothetical protein [Paraburkholderia tropica]